MKWWQNILIVVIVATVLVSCRLNPPTEEGYTPNESRSIHHSMDVDSCLNKALAYIDAADILEPFIVRTDNQDKFKEFHDIQLRYLDSAAYYKSEADRLLKGD